MALQEVMREHANALALGEGLARHSAVDLTTATALVRARQQDTRRSSQRPLLQAMSECGTGAGPLLPAGARIVIGVRERAGGDGDDHGGAEGGGTATVDDAVRRGSVGRCVRQWRADHRCVARGRAVWRRAGGARGAADNVSETRRRHQRGAKAARQSRRRRARDRACAAGASAAPARASTPTATATATAPAPQWTPPPSRSPPNR